MKIALAQLNYHVGNFETNYSKIAQSIEKASAEAADLVVFSELAVCGYPPYDLLEQKDFVFGCLEYVNRIAALTHQVAVLVGAPSLNPHENGKNLYNSAYFLYQGQIQMVFHKSLLPTYDVFDEYRHFEPNHTFSVIEFKGKKLAVTVCEDLWDDQPLDNPFGKSKLYTVSPMQKLAKLNPDVVINIAASPYSSNKNAFKEALFTGHAKRYAVPLFYVNQTGANSELIFDGGSMVVAPNGNVYDRMALFTEDFKVFDLMQVETSTPRPALETPDRMAQIYDALVLGIRDYFAKMGFSKAVLGLSGGIDSALVAVLASEALGPENVLALLMPSQYSSDHSIKDAEDLARNLGINWQIIPIQPVVDSFTQVLQPLFGGLKTDVTEENIQARIRGVLLMAASNKFGHLLLNTTNKSEAAVGYGTLYGDMCGALAVLGDIYKTEVFKLAYYINRNQEIIPNNTIVKPPSAELRPDQKDSDSLPDYPLLDDILFHYIEIQQSLAEILSSGKNEQAARKAIRLTNINEYKRFQMAPVLRVTSKAFGFGRRIPIVAKL